MKQGVIVVNHGTTDHNVRQKTIDDFALSIGDRLEEADIVSVYTDPEVRRQLREKTGEKFQNLKAAILSMKERGVTDLVVVSTDIHDGPEYRQLMDETVSLATLFQSVNISKPLVYSDEDYEITARALHGAFSDIVGDDIFVLLISGDKEYGVEEMEGLEKSLQKHFAKGYVSALHGEHKLYKVIKKLKQESIDSGRVVFVPFEFMAGETVENEVSQEYTVLAERLKDEGYTVETLFKGIAEYDAMQRLYMRHLYDAMR